MQSSLNLSSKKMSNYTSNGYPVRQQEADKRMSEINDFNKENSNTLKSLKLYTFTGDLQSFPDKFSNDLADIQKTCQIENLLIRKIRQVEGQMANQHAKDKDLHIDLQTQLDKVKKKLSQQEKRSRQFQRKLNEAQDNCEKLKKASADMEGLQNIIKFNKKKIKSLEFDLELSRTQFSDLRQDQSNLIAKSKKINFKMFRGPENSEDFKPSRFINNDWAQNEANKNLTLLQKFYSQNLQSQKKEITAENEKLKSWLMKFIDKIEKIFKIKLQKLRESGQTQQEIFINFKYMAMMHLNVINSFDKSDFPFSEMLDDFEKVVRESDQYKFQLDRMSLASQIKALDREIVTNAINALRQFNSIIIKEFQEAKGQRKKIAEEYQKFLKPQLDGMEWLEEFNVKDIKRFIDRPCTILKELEEELIQMKGKKEKIMKEHGVSGNSFFQKMDASNDHAKQFIDKIRNSKQKQQLRNQVFMMRQEGILSMRKNVEKSFPVRENKSKVENTKRQREIDLETAKIQCRDRFRRIPIDEELKRIGDQIEIGRDIQVINQDYSQVFRRGGNYADDLHPINHQPRELEMRMQNLIEESQRIRNRNLNEDVEI